jgi:hypothetical protein
MFREVHEARNKLSLDESDPPKLQNLFLQSTQNPTIKRQSLDIRYHKQVQGKNSPVFKVVKNTMDALQRGQKVDRTAPAKHHDMQSGRPGVPCLVAGGAGCLFSCPYFLATVRAATTSL